MERTRRARRLAWSVAALTAIVALAMWVFPQPAREFVAAHDTFFKLTGAALGPLLALLGFVLSRLDKAALADVAQQKGAAEERARAEAERARAEAARAQRANEDATRNLERIRVLEGNLKTIADSRQLWKLRRNEPFPDYRSWKHDPAGAKILAVSLFKGGVGKTHLAANFAAYVSEKQQKPVLLIDLDYQGSLSTMMLLAANIEQKESNVDALFDEKADLVTLNAKRVHLANHGAGVALNGGKGLGRAWIVPAQYSLTAVESSLLIDRVITPRPALDERYRLAHVLLHPSVRREYAMIIIDTPPRMTLGTANALVASHSYVVPTIFDRISSEALMPFFEQLKLFKQDMELELPLAGIVGTLTRQAALTPVEAQVRDRIISLTTGILEDGDCGVLADHLPRKAQVTNNDDLGYFLRDGEGPLAAQFYDPIFDELWNRVMSP